MPEPQFWMHLVLVCIPAPSLTAYQAMPEPRPKVTTRVISITRQEGHSRHVRDYNAVVDVDPKAASVRIAWYKGDGRARRAMTTIVPLGVSQWMLNGTSTVHAAAFTDKAAANAWAASRRANPIPGHRADAA